MDDPLILDGVRYCKRCVAKLGGDKVKATTQPGIFNWETGVRHLNKNASYLTTLCGLETKSDRWALPYRFWGRRR